MNSLQTSRQQIALNFVLLGFGIGLFFVPNILLYFVVPQSLRLLSVVCFPLGFYVIGLGAAGIIEGGIRMARSLKG